MKIDDLRILSLNSFSLAISFSNVSEALKLLLLIVSIGYTVQKWYLLRKRNK